MNVSAKRLPKSARYPIFLLGLLVIIIGNLVANSANLGLTAEASAGVIGFILLLLSVAIR